jgi:hypothetical protein
MTLQNGVWQGEDDVISVSMNHETFCTFVSAYLEVQGITEPTERQKEFATTRCLNVFYWRNCRDPRVRLFKKMVTHVNVT